ncbi:MAG: DUF4234 domain-containing protein [Nanoarchaeota archaeon]
MEEEFSFRKEDFEAKKLPQPQIAERKPVEDTNVLPNQKNIFILILLSIITIGIYPAIWYIKRAPEFHNLGTQTKLSKTLPTIYLTLAILLIVLAIFFPFTISGADLSNFYTGISPIQTTIIIGFIGILAAAKIVGLILAFISRVIMNQALSEKYSKANVSALFTFLFGFLYIQYEINRIIKDEEEKPKKGPWAVLIIIILAVLAQIILTLIGK